MARRSRTPQTRQVLKQMARYWRSLAQQAAILEELAAAARPLRLRALVT